MADTAWHLTNQRYLVAALHRVRVQLEQHARGHEGAASSVPTLPPAEAPLPALADVAGTFRLSGFEVDLLVLCAGMELDSAFPALCASASESRRPHPTYSLALAAFAGAHWSALTPSAPLRHYRLVEIDPADSLAHGRLRIDERILHHLAGVSRLDTRLHGLIEPIAAGAPLPASHRAVADRLAAAWRRAGGATRVAQICGGDASVREAVMQAACAALGLVAQALRAADLPLHAQDREALARLWEREAALAATALLIHLDDSDSAEVQRVAVSFADRVRGMAAIASRDPVRLRCRVALRFDLPPLDSEEQRAIWRGVLDPIGGGADLGRLVSHFNLPPLSIQAAGAELAERVDRGAGAGEIDRALWTVCRLQARPRLDDLAQRITPRASWDDLVLPSEQMRMLRAVAAHVRQRHVVYERWGFADKGTRGLGITALFAGSSGTGKTLAGEVIAAELDLDLYRIDLSQVVSKYIGETEKNLRRIFDAAEEGGAILLFDEADALFGKRSEVKDSHDRYANMEVSYLLQRMEAYRGLAILTTNMRGVLDQAFLRRLRFIVEFPFPGIEERAAIWRRAFPKATPTANLAIDRLARLNVTGGVIRNIALNAAFLAADDGAPVGMRHVRLATEVEFVKLERPISEIDFRGWA